MNKKIILGIIIGLLLGSISVYAGTKFYASDVSVNAPTESGLGSNATLQNALDDLYSIAANNDTFTNELNSLKSRVSSIEAKTGNKHFLYIDSFYEVEIENGIIINSSGTKTGGVVFKIPYGTTKITVTFTTENGYAVQFGMCDFEGKIPTLIATGDHRGEYRQIYQSGTYTFDFKGVAGNFYIGGSKFMITDIYAS